MLTQQSTSVGIALISVAFRTSLVTGEGSFCCSDCYHARTTSDRTMSGEAPCPQNLNRQDPIIQEKVTMLNILTVPPTTQRRLIVGDVHGQYEGLMHLLRLVSLTQHDQLYFLGDLIDRGPDSKGVLAFVRQQGYPVVLGNHESLLLEALDGKGVVQWLQNGGYATIDQYGGYKAGLDALHAYRDWLESLPHAIDLGDLFLVHAGLNPDDELEQQDPHQLCWIRDDWLYYPHPYFTNPPKTVICGHTLTFTLRSATGTIPVGQLARGAQWIGLETGAFHSKSGWLSALDWDSQLVYQVNVLTGTEQVRSLTAAVTDISLGHD